MAETEISVLLLESWVLTKHVPNIPNRTKLFGHTLRLIIRGMKHNDVCMHTPPIVLFTFKGCLAVDDAMLSTAMKRKPMQLGNIIIVTRRTQITQQIIGKMRSWETNSWNYIHLCRFTKICVCINLDGFAWI